MWKYFHRNYLYLGGAALGISAIQQLPSIWLLAPAAAAMLVLLAIKGMYREIFIFLLTSFAGAAAAGSAQKHAKPLQQASRLENIQIRITDPVAIGKSSGKQENMPNRLQAEIISKNQAIPVNLYFPQRLRNPGVAENEIYQISGNFYPEQKNLEVWQVAPDGSCRDVSKYFTGNSYKNYLQTNRISGTLVVDKLTPQAESEASLLSRIRRRLTTRLDRKFTDENIRAVLGAVTLGTRGRLSRELKNDFARVGVAHLFSISGLHVGVLAALLLLIVRPLPSVWHWLLTILLSGYVLTTGGEAPAIRAFLLIFMMEFLKSHLLRVPALQLLSLICTILLLINPYYITDAGFHYSFILTALLIAAAPLAREITRVAGGAAYFWGDNNPVKQRLLSWRGKIAGAIFYAAVAAAGSGALTLYHQNMFFAGSMLINLLILPVLMPLFVLASLKIALPDWQILSDLIELLTNYLQWLVEFFGNFAGNSSLMHITAWASALLITFIMLILAAFRWKYCLILFACGLLFTASLVLRSVWQTPQIAAVISGGSLQQPMTALLLPHAHTMYVANANREGVYLLQNLANHYGINNISRLDITHPISSCSNGIRQLLAMYPCSRIRIPDQPIRSRKFREHIHQLHLQRGTPETFPTVDGNGKSDIKISDSESGGKLLQTPHVKLEIPRTYHPRMYIIPLRQNPRKIQ